MTDMRQAAQMALEAFEYASTGNRRPKIINEALAREHAMRDARLNAGWGSEQQAEPVAWMFEHSETGRINYVSNDGMTPELFLKTNLRYALVCPLYAAPPQRPWVDLTDEDWGWVADKKETSLDTFAHGAAWAADQLKENNNG